MQRAETPGKYFPGVFGWRPIPKINPSVNNMLFILNWLRAGCSTRVPHFKAYKLC